MADEKYYVGDVGTEIRVNCGQIITGATALKLYVQKPDGTEVEWTPTIYGTDYLTYTIIADDFDQEGDYRLQSGLTLTGWTGRGEVAIFTVHGLFRNGERTYT